ncbi:hypothetical protein C8J56DRAFT_1049722 [Mycena floridula]|nr:hypothetical protein C8J56DRAFT_1049722 [Mycena floridula]
MGKLRPPRLGAFQPSPLKKRNQRKEKILVQSAPKDLRAQQLQDRMQAILDRALARAAAEREAEEEPEDGLAMEDDEADRDFQAETENEMVAEARSSPEPDLQPSQTPLRSETSEPQQQPKTRRKRRLEADEDSIGFYEKWQELLSKLVDPYLAFQDAHYGSALPIAVTSLGPVCTANCRLKTSKVQCLFMDSIALTTVYHCGCQNVFQVLVRNGLFPASPTAPRTAFSFGILEMYRALFEQSCDALNAMSSAMHVFYQHRGFPFLSMNGTLCLDPFRKSLTSAVQWFDCLGIQVADRVAEVVDLSAQFIDQHTASDNSVETLPGASGPSNSNATFNRPNIEADPGHPQPDIQFVNQFGGTVHARVQLTTAADPPQAIPTPGECHQILQDLCPACFGGRLYGRSFQEGGDIHVSTDGNFHHRHFKNAGDCAAFYKPRHILPKATVDAVRDEIHNARGRPAPKKKLPDEAIDACEESHQAAKPERKKGQPQFDDNGLMSLVCRHDIPLFFTNIDTPGEGQQYAVALIRHLFSLLPPQATVVVLYDLACVLDRSSELYEIFPANIAERLQFATTAMHAYAHQWSCQVVFNPRMRIGLGLTDGEGVERIWSALRDLIALTRHASRSQRLWMIDRLVQSTAACHHDTLGEWIRNKLKQLKSAVLKQQAVLRNCPDSPEEIHLQWEAQRASQTSMRAHLPARLKKQLHQVLCLQGDIEGLEGSICSVRATLKQVPGSTTALARLRVLEVTHARMKAEADELYASLNVTETYPELEGIDISFVQVLLLARDLKMSLRRQIIGCFFEMDRLDQAVGGGNEALGTKAHQITRKSIQKRAPVIANGIKVFNGHIDTLQEMAEDNPDCRIPIPDRLLTTIKELRDCPHLHEDVWISKSADGEIPQWLADLDLRNAIRAHLRLDRCDEERCRLGRESDNMCRWFGRKLAALELAIRCERFQPFSKLLYNTIAEELSDTDTDSESEVPASNVRLEDILEVLDLDDEGDLDEIHSPSAEISDPALPFMGSSSIALQRALPAAYQVKLLSEDALHNISSEHLLAPFKAFSQSFFPTRTPMTQSRRFFGDGRKGLCSNSISGVDIHQLVDPRGWLNDDCIIVGAGVLFDHVFRHHDHPKIALLSTYLLQQCNRVSVWNLVRHTEFWNRSIWLIPVNRAAAQHWVLYVVYLNTGTIHLFDSFGQVRGLDKEVAQIVEVIQLLINLANENGHSLTVPVESWKVIPLVDSSNVRQSNSFDCGVWVLAAIFAVLRGNESVSGISEGDMAVV